MLMDFDGKVLNNIPYHDVSEFMYGEEEASESKPATTSGAEGGDGKPNG